ncbi:MAG: diphosphomevalonate decarboxylase [Gammaproteobacteria bacterium]|nr:MAG: diphosphomevalonate decarboxylase [Gammaproteobacteria bacterium]
MLSAQRLHDPLEGYDPVKRSAEQRSHTAFAHPNIALIKYWGKADVRLNVPAVPSISITLDALATTTSVGFDARLETDSINLNGIELDSDSEQARRISSCLDQLRARTATTHCARVESLNDFPTGAGLASSASGFAALVVAAAAALDLELAAEDASRIARAASASAARSLYGGFAELPAGRPGEDVAAHALASVEHWPLEVVIAICAEGPKLTGSTQGMLDSAATSPFYSAWIETAAADAATARAAIMECDFSALAAVAESSCLKMHAIMHTTRPALIYWNAATVATLERIRSLQQAGMELFFTMDAGPQVKAVCSPGQGAEVRAALATVPGVHHVLCSGLGGPARVRTQATCA